MGVGLQGPTRWGARPVENPAWIFNRERGVDFVEQCTVFTVLKLKETTGVRSQVT
jgi:hypothetical protein